MPTIYTTLTTEDGFNMAAQSLYQHEADAEGALLSDVIDEMGCPLEPDESAAIINDAYGKAGFEISDHMLVVTIRYLRTREAEPKGCNSRED